MHILFIHAALPGVPFNCSIAALSAWLKQHGHRVSLVVVRDGCALEEFEACVSKTEADVVGLSFMTCQGERVSELVPRIRSALPRSRLIAGGAHPTTWPRETLESMDIDAICTGEGEGPMLAWLSEPEQAHSGICRQGQDDPVLRWTASDVDGLPDWDRALFGDVSNAGNRYEQAVGVALSRGFCPFTCTFCGIDAYRRIHDQPVRGAMRLRSVERCIQEMERAQTEVPCRDGFASWDAVFPLKRDWISEFAGTYRDRIGLPLAVQLRVEQVTPFLVEQLALAGADYAVVGVECGDERYRREVLDKPFTNAALLKAFERLHGAGITTHASFMVGMPFETPGMLAKTVRLARELQATELSWKYYTPERWTRLFQLCEKHELLIENFIDHPFGADRAMIRLTHCKQADLDRAQHALALVAADSPRATFATQPPPSARPLLEIRP